MTDKTKRKIRVMHVVECAGGVERYLLGLLRHLDRERVENILVCSQNYSTGAFASAADAVEQIRMEHEPGGTDLSAVWKIRRFIRKYEPDIIYAHSSKAGALARIAILGKRKICIYNPHGWAFNMRSGRSKRAVYRSAEKMMSRMCHRIVCISESERRSALEQRICPEHKLRVIYNGIDLEEAKDRSISREEAGIPEDAFVVGAAGRLAAQKAPDVFIRMAKQVREEIPHAWFLLVGGGEMEEEIRAYARKNGLADCLSITGWVKDPLPYIRLFDTALLLSRWEGFGLVLPEYMLCRKPVVAAASDGIRDIIRDGSNGLLVPPDAPRAAARGVLRLYRDPRFARRLAEQGLRDVREQYDIRRTAAQHEELFGSMGV